MSVSPEPQVESKFPDCVAMKLHLQAKKASSLFSLSKQVTAHPKEFDLSFIISFTGEQEIVVPGGTRLGLPGGRATLGIKRGKLRLTLQNCKLLLEKTTLLEPFKASSTVQTRKTKSSSIQAGAASNAPSIGTQATEGSTEKTTVEVFQVEKIGSEDKPAWIFEAYGDRPILEGMLTEIPLGTLQVDELPCEIAADFMVRGEDVQITWRRIEQENVHHYWARRKVEKIHPNKLAVIERAIALRYIKSMVESEPRGQGRWTYGRT